MQTFRNIHVQTGPRFTPAVPADQVAPRLRFVTNSPAREYSERPGEVEPLPDAVAALILSKQGFSKVGRNGIRIEGLAPKALTFWCENSATIIEKAGTNEKVLWTINRQRPDVLHILTPDGEYVESIPLDGKVPWFDAGASAEILGAKRRANHRRMQRIADLHAPDTEEAIERETELENQIKGIVQTFPAAAGRVTNGAKVTRVTKRSDCNDVTPVTLLTSRPAALETNRTFSRATRIHEVQQRLHEQRAEFHARESEVARRVADVTEDDIDSLLLNSDADRFGVAVRTATQSAAVAEDDDFVL